MNYLRELYLTFDVEDFISDNSVESLTIILTQLKKYDLTGLFFVTGHMAEKLGAFPEVLDLLNDHQIGYHSSAHTVHPTIFEFTDTEDYQQAYLTSLKHETAHINPLTGDPEGPGGIIALKTLFPKKQIVAFRAPGYCWHPAHLEALRTLGIQFDFSADISAAPVSFKDIVFYPYPILPSNWWGTGQNYRLLIRKLLTHQTNVLTVHPSDMVNEQFWDLIYSKSNPVKLTAPPIRYSKESEAIFSKFDLLLKRINWLRSLHLLNITPSPKQEGRNLDPENINIEACFQKSMEWAKYLGYEPKFIYSHFKKFFEN